MEKLKLIIDWAKLPKLERIVTTLAVFIITILGIVYYFLEREAKQKEEYDATLKDRDQRYFNQVEYHARYVDEKETEYQKILVELNKINNK